nr:MAG TPA: portal protein [Caudoviricetes sp.]
MAFSFFRRAPTSDGMIVTESLDDICREIAGAALEYAAWDYAQTVCINMIANAVGRAEFRTFRRRAEVQEEEYYLWNVEPNANQNSTQFLHQLISSLCRKNEALVISPRRRNGSPVLVVADSWEPPELYPTRQNVYRGVTAGQDSYDRAFYERDVLHIKLNHIDAGPIAARMRECYARVYAASRRAYLMANGQRWKVHVSTAARTGSDDFNAKFRGVIEAQLKPFLESPDAVLPEMDGYEYVDLGAKTAQTSRDLSALTDDIFGIVARQYQISGALINGKIEGTKDAEARTLAECIDPICDQLQEEINRKRYGYEAWAEGSYMLVDTSAIRHFDIFDQAASVEKLVGSGVYLINDVLRAVGQPESDDAIAKTRMLTKNFTAAEDAAGMKED